MKPEYQKFMVKKKLERLCKDMNPALVLSRLVKKRVFQQYDVETVQHVVTTQDKTMLIMDILMERDFTALSEFLSILASIDSAHYKLARMVQPVENHIAWFVPSPTHAAAVVYTLEKYAGAKFSKMTRCGEGKSLVVRRGRVFPREFEEDEGPVGDLPPVVVDTEKMVMQSHQTEVSLVFPTAGSDVASALEKWFQAGLTDNAKLILMGGVSCGGRAGETKAVIATQVFGGVAGGEKVCAGVNDGEVKSLERRLSRTLAEHTEAWVEEEGDGSQPEVRFVSVPKGESRDSPSTADSPLFKFYELCKRNCPNQRSLLCQGIIPDVARSRTAVGPETTAAISCSCILMEVCKFYFHSPDTCAQPD